MALEPEGIEVSVNEGKKKSELFWAIRPKEFKPFVFQFLIFFLLCGSYSILRNLKDTLILTASPVGAEIIPFLKVWGILPTAFLATWFYTLLCNIFRREVIFYLLIFLFLSFYLSFALFIYPNADSFHLDGFARELVNFLPQGFSGAIAMLQYWTFSLFYVLSEIWSSIVLTVLFWGFVNEVTTVSQAKRIYGFLNIGSNLAPIMAGTLAVYFVHNISLPSFFPSSDALGDSLIKLILLITLFSAAASLLFYRLNRLYSERQKEEMKAKKSELKKKQTDKISLWGSLKFIAKSPYLLSIAILVLSFNASINFTDILWKSQLKNYFSGNPDAILVHMNQVTVGIGIISTLIAVFFTWIIKRIGWRGVAALTPVSMGITGLGFFTLYFGRGVFISESFTLFALTPLALTVYLGSLQNCLSKAGKYSAFDASKEIAFLKRDAHSRLQAKAAIDGLGSGFGKSGSSLSYQVLLVFFGSLGASTPIIAGIIFILLVLWFFAIKVIAKEI